MRNREMADLVFCLPTPHPKHSGKLVRRTEETGETKRRDSRGEGETYEMREKLKDNRNADGNGEAQPAELGLPVHGVNVTPFQYPCLTIFEARMHVLGALSLITGPKQSRGLCLIPARRAALPTPNVACTANIQTCKRKAHYRQPQL